VKSRKHSPAARVFYIFRMLSNVLILSQCNRRPRLLHLLCEIEPGNMMAKYNKTRFFNVLYTDKHGLLTNQRAHGPPKL